MPAKAKSNNNPSDSQELPERLAIYKGKRGRDLMDTLQRDKLLRPVIWEDRVYLSMVSLATRFGDERDKSNPRLIWQNWKRRLQTQAPHLYSKLIQMKIRAEDGKMRPTDVLPLDEAFRSIAYLNTPAANLLKEELLSALASHSTEELRHRAYQIAHGSEWAADSIHQELLQAGLTHPDPTDEVWGKDRWGNR